MTVNTFQTALELIGKVFEWLTTNSVTQVIIAISLIVFVVGVIISKVKG